MAEATQPGSKTALSSQLHDTSVCCVLGSAYIVQAKLPCMSPNTEPKAHSYHRGSSCEPDARESCQPFPLRGMIVVWRWPGSHDRWSEVDNIIARHVDQIMACRQPPKALIKSSSKGVAENACSNIMSDLGSRTIGRLVHRLS
jgi:hypothetical protein